MGYWKFASPVGRPLEYTPDELWAKAVEYFKWCEENPWKKNEAIKGGDMAGEIVQIPTARPFTLRGFCLFADITHKTFDNYANRPEFLLVTTRVREICYSQKFEGAAVGAFNANIIARDLGLREVNEVNLVTNRKEVAQLFHVESENQEPESSVPS